MREPSAWDAVFALLALVVLIATSIYLYGIDAMGGPLQLGLLTATMIAGLIAHKNGHTFKMIGEGLGKGMMVAMSPVFILLMVGALIGAWNMSGTIATIVYYGVNLLDPNWFYLAVALLAGLFGLAVGSSWTTAATVGVALVGIASVGGLSIPITAGAVISGAYFGDKMSPISETTVLAPSLVGSTILEHIRSMAWSTLPAFAIALGIFGYLGVSAESSAPAVDIASLHMVLDSAYNISPLTLLPILVLVFLSFKRYPSALSIFGGALAGIAVAVVMQPSVVVDFADASGLNTVMAMVKGSWSAMSTGFVLTTGIGPIDELFSGGGVTSMLFTVLLVLSAVAFGAIMEYAGFTERLVRPVLERTRSAGGLIAATMATSIGFNIIAGDQYVALIIPTRMFAIEFKRRGLHPETLATAVENSGTVTSPLIPWNSCGAYMATTLGVSTATYLPYCYFNLINPVIGLVYGILGFKVQRLDPAEDDESSRTERN